MLDRPGSKVLMLMTDSRPLPKKPFAASNPVAAQYWVSAVYINLLYSLRHGYSFMRVALPSRGLLRHSSW